MTTEGLVQRLTPIYLDRELQNRVLGAAIPFLSRTGPRLIDVHAVVGLLLAVVLLLFPLCRRLATLILLVLGLGFGRRGFRRGFGAGEDGEDVGSEDLRVPRRQYVARPGDLSKDPPRARGLLPLR